MGLCLVTGGAGFIGRWLVSELLQRRRRVLVLDNLSGGCRANLAEFSGRPGYEGLIRGDIRNPGTLYELFFRGLECCYHLAPGIDAGKSLEEPQETFESVVGGTMGLLEMCREYDTKMVFVSTSRVYAESGAAIAEDFPLAPRSPYAACKLAAENLCLGYHRAYRLPVVIVRPFAIYGPFQRCEPQGGTIAPLQPTGGSPLRRGDGEQIRDFVYVEDCAALVAAAGLLRRCEGEILNAASGRGVPLGELAEMISGDPAGVAARKRRPTWGEPSRMVGDGSRAEAIAGWKASVGLREGIGRTRAWMEAAAREERRTE